ncbi:MAG: hypothetical protein HY099_02845 [Nitrospirae bacterium]|nr:hypothetical protein [Nitrospirota bacterium]
MSKREHLLILPIAVILAFLMQGCANNISVKRDSVIFRERAEKLPLSVGLFLSDKAQNYSISGEISSDTINFQIGKALESSATESLKKAFRAVSVIHEKTIIEPGIERIITLEFGPSSKFTYGGATLSEHTATVELICEVYDNKWTLLWKTTAHGAITRTTREAGVAFVIIGMLGESVQLKALGSIVNESLASALESLNDQILISGKDAILGNYKPH